MIADNGAGHLLMRGEVDLVIVGADRIAANGDTANKIGTYLKALAAFDCGVAFHVAAPLSTVDWQAADGSAIPIEQRGSRGGTPHCRHRCAGPRRRGQSAAREHRREQPGLRRDAGAPDPQNFITERGCVAPGQLGMLAHATM